MLNISACPKCGHTTVAVEVKTWADFRGLANPIALNDEDIPYVEPIIGGDAICRSCGQMWKVSNDSKAKVVPSLEAEDEEESEPALLTKTDHYEFSLYLRNCTDNQVRGVWEKEKQANRENYAALAEFEAARRGIVLEGWAMKKLTKADTLLLALLCHRETPTASPEGRDAALYLRAKGFDPLDHWGAPLPLPSPWEPL